MDIAIDVIDQKLRLKTDKKVGRLVSGTQEFVRFVFNLTSDWDGLSVLAQFNQGGVAYNQYLDSEHGAFLPAEIKAGSVTLMLYGTGGTTIGTTNYLTFQIDKDIFVTDANSTDISQSLYTQLVNQFNDAETTNKQLFAELKTADENLQRQVNAKATQTALDNEIQRAKTAEQANATAIAGKAAQTEVDELKDKVNALENNEVIAEKIEDSVKAEMQRYLDSGALANMAIVDGSVTRSKVDTDFEKTLKNADTAMQPSVYDPQNLNVDVFAFAQGRADTVQTNLNIVREEIKNAYTLTDTVKYTKLGDAVRGVYELAKNYTQALLVDYKAFTIKVVDSLPVTGDPMVFYLLPNDSGTGYDKYWWITDNDGVSKWDVFGSSSTLIVTELPTTGDADVDYILKSDAGCMYYKWIDNEWQVVAGSIANVVSALPETGNEFTDYYLLVDGSYVHYRWINGTFQMIGGSSYSSDEMDEQVAIINDAISAVEKKVDTNTDNISANTTNITALSNSMTALQQEVKSMDVEGYTYYATYGTATLMNGEEAENVYTLYECKDGSEEVKSQFVISGGGGGSVSATNLVVERVTASPIIVTPTDKVEIQINYSSTDADGELIDGTYSWKLGNSVIDSGTLVQGLNTFDFTDKVTIGTQKLYLTVVDEGGSMNVKSWTVQVVDVRMDSNFNDKLTYTAGRAVNFTYTPYGSVSKTVHMVYDGVELDPVTVTASGTLQSYTLDPSVVDMSHGAHLLETYITATVNNMTIETEHIYKNIMCYDSSSTVPIIGCVYRNDYYGKVATRQYNTVNIQYYVFDPNTGTPAITHTHNDVVSSNLTLTSNSNIWSFKTDVIGEHTLVISCGETSVTIVLDVAELGIDVSPITAGLAFDFNPTGMSNTSENRLWFDSDTGVTMTVSDNFDWTNGGYQLDDNGDQYFCVKAGTSATINYNLFERDASLYGSEFKIIFRVDNVRDADATFLSCQSGETNVVGLQMDAHAAYFKTSATGSSPLYIPYSESDIIEFELNIETLDTENADATSVIFSYEDGVPFRPLIYDATHRLYQYDPVPIVIGSPDCDVHIYRMKAFENAMTDRNVLTNFIADARNSDDMLDRYYRNQIYNENNVVTPESVAAACPDLKIIKIDCPYFTKDKNEMIKNTTVECIHKNGDTALDNWKATNCYHSGQGTTSNEYGYAGRNLNIYMCFDGEYQHKRVAYDPDYITELTMGDGTKYSDGTGKVTLTRTSVPNNLYNIKVNIASSENANNALLQKRFHRFLPYTTVASKRDPNAKTTMEFVNCVVFVRENNSDLTTHREFQDTDWHFYALGNFGDSKDTDQTRTNDPDDHNEFVVEISDNTKPNSIFPSGVTDDEGKMVYPIEKSQWVAGNPAYDTLYGNWDDTFEFRYEHPDITDEEQTANIQIWNDFYEWIVTSTDEEFVNELKDWAIDEAFLYMYLFTERYTMIDNRAKNTFWHYGKVYVTQAEATAMGEAKAARYTIDDEAASIRNGYRFDSWNYDNDTAIGINNSGEMTMTYGKEDTDYRTDGDPNSGYIYNAADSVFFCRIRDLMYSRLQATYQTRESARAWSASDLITEFDTWQEQFPEILWILDVERKYRRTYLGGGLDGGSTPSVTPRFLATMMNGRKKYHRRQWERDQEIYIGTKYVGANVKADQIMFRCNTPQSAIIAPNYDLSIVPYSDMYLSVLYGNSPAPIQIRAKAGVEYKITSPWDTDLSSMTDTAILVYAASRIQAMNDLSACYIHDNDFTKASKLQKLVIGNSTDGYANSFLTDLNIGGNYLLKELNVRNCPNLVGSINFNSCGNLETFYAEGTAITGVIFAPNGKIVTAYLPDTINTLDMRYLKYLSDLQMTYDNLETLTVLNSIVLCNGTDDVRAIIEASVDTLETLYVSGIDWTLTDTSMLNRILMMNSSTLIGKAYVSGNIRNQELANYNATWPDFTITYDSDKLISQYLVTYVNGDDNNTILYQTYVDRGSAAPDPYAEGLIDIPTLPADAQYTYSFGTHTDGVYDTGSGWDGLDGAVIAERTITAIYTKTIRTYTVTWYSRAGVSLGSKVVNYGEEALYDGDRPTNTSEEDLYIYNVFNGWNKSTAVVTEDIDVYAIWDRAELPSTDKVLSEMTPAEIYAVAKTGQAGDRFEMKDFYDMKLGKDFDFENVESHLLAEDQYFDGATAIETGIKLFGENDTSFTIAIDFQFTDTSTTGATLVSCYEESGAEGFRLKYSSAPCIEWGNVYQYVGNAKYRDIVVLRHKKGEDTLHIYCSNGTNSDKYADDITHTTLTRNRSTSTESQIVLGAVQFIGDGGFDYHGTGFIHWAKVWLDDLGDTNARVLAAWPHEPARIEFCGAGRYRLAGNTSKKSNASFIFNNLLWDRGHQMNTVNTNSGGWEVSYMREFIGNRLIKALPTVWESMLVKVKINSTIGDKSTEVYTSEDYVYIPCQNEMGGSNSATYADEGDHIEWFTSDIMRAKFKGIIIPEDASYYSGTSEPSTQSGNTVKFGDVWKNGNCMVYVTQDYLDRFNIAATTESNIGGGWMTMTQWWLRSPNITTTYWWHVYTSGSLSTSTGNLTLGVCPCFSI